MLRSVGCSWMLMSLHSMPLLLVQKQCTQGRAKKAGTCRNILLPWACSIYILQLTELAQEIFGLSPCQHIGRLKSCTHLLPCNPHPQISNWKHENLEYLICRLSSVIQCHPYLGRRLMHWNAGWIGGWLAETAIPSSVQLSPCIALALGLCGHPQLLQFINDMNIYIQLYIS